MSEEKKEVIDTNGIPQCPHCEKPTKRQEGVSSMTCAYYPVIYDENGVNTNPDRNTTTTTYSCLGCSQGYTVSGNYTDGFYYN